VAFAQPTQGEITTPEYPVGGYRILGVGRTAGVKPAMIAQKGTQAGLIAVDKKNEQATH
jgi:hypothetical protein